MSKPEAPLPETGEESQLRRLERELYSRKSAPEIEARANDMAQLGIRRHQLSEDLVEQESMALMDRRTIRRQRRRRWLYFGLGAAVLAILLAGGVGATIWYRLRQNVTSEQISIAIEVPAEAQAGDELTYVINYGNASFVDWENVEVSFEFPTGFTVTKTEPELSATGNHIIHQVGGLPSGAANNIRINGRLLAEENASVVAKAEIYLTPENFPGGRFTRSTVAATTVIGAALDVAIEAAREAGVGERVAAVITVTNKSKENMEGIYLDLKPAVGLKVATEDAEFSPGYSIAENRWYIPSLSSLETQSKTAVLFLTGEPGEQRALDIMVGLERGGERFVQQRASLVLTISSSELSVTQRYQTAESPLVVRSGEKVSGLIRYANLGTEGLKNVVVRARIEGDSFDPSALKLRSGAYDPLAKTITWTSSTVPELTLLKPQQGGEISYEFTIKPAAQLPAEPSSKNSIIMITALVDSPDVRVPVGEERKVVQDQFVMSVVSEITLAADAFYDDGRLGLKSTGPMPPQVGQETSFSVRLRLGSTLNDLGELNITAVLPDGVRYTGKHVATAGEIDYEERTGKLLWTVAQVPGLTGRASPTADLYFQVSIVPGEDQKGNLISLLNRLVATGTDIFVDEELMFEVTTYPTTESAVPGKGRVE